MLRLIAFAVIAAVTFSSVPAFAKGKSAQKSDHKKVVVHRKAPRRH